MLFSFAGADLIQETPTPSASKRRSRWDETPSATPTPSQVMTPGGMTPTTPHGTPGHTTPMLTPGGSTPVGVKAMAMATPAPCKFSMIQSVYTACPRQE